tara:strand:+ start:159 stop:302 length:144 start_codon:yes stop_codon:yes gene_type:complete
MKIIYVTYAMQVPDDATKDEIHEGIDEFPTIHFNDNPEHVEFVAWSD